MPRGLSRRASAEREFRRASQDGTLLEAEHLADLAVVWDSDEDSSRDYEDEERQGSRLRSLATRFSSSLSVKKKGALGKLLSPSKTPDISPPGAGSSGQQNASLAFRASTNGKTPIAPSWNANSDVESGDGVNSDDDFVDPAEYERARQMLELEDREQAAAASSASNSSRLQLRSMNATGEGPASSSSTSTSASTPTASRYSYSEHHKRTERRVSLPVQHRLPAGFDVPSPGRQPYPDTHRGLSTLFSAQGPFMSTNPLTYEFLLEQALCGDTLSMICNLLGLRTMWTMGAVCTKWHDAIHTKMREWGVLTYVSTLGKGFGKLPGYFDMPTWLCMVPDGWYGSNLCIVDSCNYRLAIMATSGECLRTVGRPGARLGELSSPSSVTHDPKRGGRPVVFSSSSVGPDDRRVLAFDLETWRLNASTPEGTGKTELDAPEGMAVHGDRLFVVDTAHHRIVAFDAGTLKKVGQYPPPSWHQASQGKSWDQLNNPHDIAAYEGELFVSDTHNDRIQVFTCELEHIGIIGQRGRAAGQFTYPRGVTVARSGKAPPLLYVCEQTRIQALTTLGEPRSIIQVPGALNLCGICSDGVRVYCTDMDLHKIHVLRLMHEERWQEKRREAIEEARKRRALMGESTAATAQKKKDAETAKAVEKSEKERKRDRAARAVLHGKTVYAMLGLPSNATESELRQGVRMAMRLLHPDLNINMALKGTKQGHEIEAAFKRVNNLKDSRIEQWFHGTPL